MNQDLKKYVTKTLVQACPKAESPITIAIAEQSLGYTFLKNMGRCEGKAKEIGIFPTAQLCRDKVAELKGKYFNYGFGALKNGICISVDTTADNCPEGFKPEKFGFYKVLHHQAF